MTLNLAFVGCGMVSELHHAAIEAIPDLNLVGIFDSDQKVRETRAGAWGVRAYDSREQLLADGRVEAVYVLSPAETHFEVAAQCLEAGRHVLVEKPVSFVADEVEKLAEIAAGRNLVAMPGHNYAYIPEIRRIPGLLKRGSFGDVRGVWINFAIRHPEEIAKAYGGVLEEVLVHHAYLALLLLGPPLRLHAGVHDPAWVKHPKEDQAWMVWEYEHGTMAWLFATMAADDNSADPWSFQVKVIGTKGGASASWRGAVARNDTTSWFAFGIPIYEESYIHESVAFRDAIAGKEPPVSSLDDAATVARIVEAGYEAARRHVVIERHDGGSWSW